MFDRYDDGCRGIRSPGIRASTLQAVGKANLSKIRIQVLPLPGSLGVAIDFAGTVKSDSFRGVGGRVR